MSGAVDGTDVAGRFAEALFRRGLFATLRMVSVLPGPQPQPNPPTLIDSVVDGDQSAGATTLSLRAIDAVGRIVAGDTIGIDSAIYTATADVVADDTGRFSAIPITPALTASITNGESVSLFWIADEQVMAKIESYPRRIVDGELTNLRDMQLLIAARGLPGEIQTTWRLLIGSDERTIVSAMPTYLQNVLVAWRVVAR